MVFFGKTDLGGSYYRDGGDPFMCVCKFTSPNDLGTIVKLWAFINGFGGTPDVKGVIYSDDVGSPHDLLAVGSAVLDIAQDPADDVVELPIDFVGDPLTDYWLGFASNGGVGYFYDAGDAGQTVLDLHNRYLVQPNPWSNFDELKANEVSICAEYVPSGGSVGLGFVRGKHSLFGRVLI